MGSSNDGAVDRRRVLKAVAASAAATSIAGCSGSGDGDDTPTDGSTGDGTPTDGDSTGGNQQGERVPTIVVEYLPSYAMWSNSMPLIKRHIEEALDVTVEAKPVEVAKFLEDDMNDKRNHHFTTWGWNTQPSNFDPGSLLRDFAVDFAGANGQPNWGNYANCEYSELAIGAQTTGDQTERNEMLAEAQRIYSEDRVEISIVSRDNFAAGRKDAVEFNSLGDAKMSIFNPVFFTDSRPRSGDRWVYGTDYTFAESRNHLQEDSSVSTAPWNFLVHSPLLIYDQNRELVPELASDYTVEDDGQRVTIKLTDATFHNGDPLTAEDVKFTYEFIEEKEVPLANSYSYDEITVVDDRTVEVTFSEPAPTFVTQHMPIWGILHRPTWEGADGIADFDPGEVVGSGPFQLSAFEQNRSITLDPHPEGHPRRTPENSLVLFKFSDNETKTRALRQNEIQAAGNIVGADLDRLSDTMQGSQLQEAVSDGIGAWKLMGSYPRPPCHNRALMDALGMAINRQQINEAVFGGRVRETPHSGQFLTNHPFSPPEEDIHFYTDDPTGDAEGARQRLEDAGFTWDDGGNLRYPPDFDPQPLWPEGEVPGPDNFPCVNDDGEWVGTES